MDATQTKQKLNGQEEKEVRLNKRNAEWQSPNSKKQ